jgi:hypothetical protein
VPLTDGDFLVLGTSGLMFRPMSDDTPTRLEVFRGDEVLGELEREP